MKLTNTVDIIYSAWPALLYTNPAIGRYLLEPLLAYQLANPVQGGYAIHDLGEWTQAFRRSSLACLWFMKELRCIPT